MTFMAGTGDRAPMGDRLRHVPVVVARPQAVCPVCGKAGEPTELFREVYMCLTDGCRVWTFETDV